MNSPSLKIKRHIIVPSMYSKETTPFCQLAKDYPDIGRRETRLGLIDEHIDKIKGLYEEYHDILQIVYIVL